MKALFTLWEKKNPDTGFGVEQQQIAELIQSLACLRGEGVGYDADLAALGVWVRGARVMQS